MLGDSNNITLLLGGVRSGKSDYAENIAVRSGLSVTYLATAKDLDAELNERVTHHQNSRPAHWKCIDVPVHLADAIRANSRPDCCLIVDCLFMWIKNLIMEDNKFCTENSSSIKLGKTFEHEIKQLFDVIPDVQGKLIFISNEVGMGSISTTTFSKLLTNELGHINQQIAKVCSHVYLLVAGLPITVKSR